MTPRRVILLRSGERELPMDLRRDHLFPMDESVKAFSGGRAAELNGGSLRVGVTKRVRVPVGGRRVELEVRLKNRSSRQARFLFGSETALRIKDAHVNRVGEASGIRRFSVVDPAARLEVEWAFNRPTRLWHFPRETVRGRQRWYRGMGLIWLWPISLKPGGSWKVRWEVSVEEAW